MAHFYGNLHSNNGQVTRTGSKSGITGHIRGWNVGIKVDLTVDENGKDLCMVYLTGGSNRNHHDKLIGKYHEDDLE